MTIESDAPDPYEVLGVRTDATDDQVRKAWRKKTKTTGPGTAEFAAFNDAAELLLDRVRRSAYDADV
ncbi:MAG: J domain-containing protein, partial [Marmoricola sp.]